jgi:hypothetical protein
VSAEAATADEVASVPVVPDVLREALEPLLEVLPVIEAEEEGLRAQLDAKREERKRIERTLTTAGLIQAPAAAEKPRTQRMQDRSYGSKKMLARLEAALDKLPDGGAEPFTVKQMSDASGVTDTTAKRGLEGLKVMGVVRLVGLRRPSYTKHGKAVHYAKLGSEG